jgi:hypothetical protein
MADSGIFRINPLQGWQRDAILKAAQLLRDRFGEADDQALTARDGLLEVLDPARRTARLQKELSDATRATRAAAPPEKAERRQRDRRATDRRKASGGPAPDQPERRRRERRTAERRNKR